MNEISYRSRLRCTFVFQAVSHEEFVKSRCNLVSYSIDEKVSESTLHRASNRPPSIFHYHVAHRTYWFRNLFRSLDIAHNYVLSPQRSFENIVAVTSYVIPPLKRREYFFSGYFGDIVVVGTTLRFRQDVCRKETFFLRLSRSLVISFSAIPI